LWKTQYEALIETRTFKYYKNKVNNQLNKKIKVIKKSNKKNNKGGEYEAPFGGFCLKNYVIHQTTTLHSLQQNDIVECKNQL
jgi:hypothetical protein